MIEAWDKYGQRKDPFEFAQECGCSQHPYARCGDARRIYNALRFAKRQHAMRGRCIQLAVEYATHLYDLRRSLRP